MENWELSVFHFVLALIPESPGEDAEDHVRGNFCYLGPDDDAKIWPKFGCSTLLQKIR